MTTDNTTSAAEATTRTARLRHHVSDAAWRAGYSMPCKDGVYALVTKRGDGCIALTTESLDEIERFLEQKATEQAPHGDARGDGALGDGETAPALPRPHASGWPLWKPPIDAQPSIDEMFSEHQAIYHQAGEVSQERLDRMIALHGQILDATPASAADLAQQLIVHHGDGDNLADVDELMNILRPIAGTTGPGKQGPADPIFAVIAWHRRAAGTEDAVFALDSLVNTRPISPAGILALARYAAEIAGDDDEDGDDEMACSIAAALFSNIALGLRIILSPTVVNLSDIMTAFGEATPEVAEKAMNILRAGQRKDGADVQ